MSYLHLAEGIPDFSKAVISLWFRAPKASVQAVANAQGLDAGIEGFFMLQQILPLITFGQPQVSKTYSTPTRNVAVIHPYLPGEPDPATTYVTGYYVEGGAYGVDPSHIGLFCQSDGTIRIQVILQMGDHMPLGATTFITTQMDIYSGADPTAPVPALGNGVVSLFPNIGVSTIADASYTDIRQPEFFQVNSDKFYDPDTWHHLLLSFDVGGDVSIGTPFASSSCRLWYAIDDVDYRGATNMQPFRDDADALDQNAIVTSSAYRYSGADPDNESLQYYQNRFVGLPSGTYSPQPIPSRHPIGIPAATKYLEGVANVEMAEFQMWTGVTLDTGVESNRRAFIDFVPDEQVGPDGKRTMQPVSPEAAEKLLGKKPAILLHGASDWIDGKNTGTTGVDYNTKPPTEKPSGQFQVISEIWPYTPDPTLPKAP